MILCASSTAEIGNDSRSQGSGYSVYYLPVEMMRLNVRLMRGRRTFFRTGRLWYQKVLVGEFMRSRLPWANTSLTGSMRRLLCLPRASLWRKTKSRAAPSETEAMGDRGSSSLSSSRCSPMWSCPSLYLEKTIVSWLLKPFCTCYISYLLIRTKLNASPVTLVTDSRIYSRVGVHGQAKRGTPE